MLYFVCVWPSCHFIFAVVVVFVVVVLVVVYLCDGLATGFSSWANV